MAPKPRTVTAKALQALLSRIGSASSGTKATLQERFVRDVRQSRLFEGRSDWQARSKKDWGNKLRIVSIDMGIKNLAYCDVEVDFPSKEDLSTTMEIIRWEKIDLVKSTRAFRQHLPSPKNIKKGSADEDAEVDPYSLTVLSETAYTLIRNTILTGAPDVILIEKQRWRSGGGSAVQQWTVRVNTLEGMLWAVLETLRREWQTSTREVRDKIAKRDYEVYAVDPKRVGHYWLNQTGSKVSTSQADSSTDEDAALDSDPGESKKKVSRTKAEKKAKIAILRSWLSSNPPTTALSTRDDTPSIAFKINQGAEATLQALCSTMKPARRRKSKTPSDKEADNVVDADAVGETELKKLDDITDCVLQAAAFVSWELNRLQLKEIDLKTREQDDLIAFMSDTVILEMAQKTGEA